MLSSNDLTGTVPNSIWYSNITSLDLSLNRLQGTLPSDMLPAAQAMLLETSMGNVSVKLQVNQVAGNIPNWFASLLSGNIDMLEGNLFSCKTDRSDLLENDPKADTYECGSDSTNYALIMCVLLLICLTLFMICMRQIRKTATWSMESFQLQYTETSIDIDVLWKHIQHSVYIMVGMWLLGMVLFAILSIYFSFYADVYVWVVSGIYKMGEISALAMLSWFIVCLLLVTVCMMSFTDIVTA